MSGAATTMRYGIGMRTQYPQGDDMVKRTEDQLDQARWADKLGFDSLMKSQHLAGYPLQEFQQVPFLARVMGEAPNLRLITGIVLLSLHKPLDLAEQLATKGDPISEEHADPLCQEHEQSLRLAAYRLRSFLVRAHETRDKEKVVADAV